MQLSLVYFTNFDSHSSRLLPSICAWQIDVKIYKKMQGFEKVAIEVKSRYKGKKGGGDREWFYGLWIPEGSARYVQLVSSNGIFM